MDDFVTINVRLKPEPKRKSKSTEHSLKVISSDPAVLFSVDKQQTFNFDKIFTEQCSQDEVYRETVKPLVHKVKEGYNCTIFAYGQTGTGKTYTMGTNPAEKDAGIISKVLEEFFICDNDQIEYDIHVSFMEIYNEKVFDLLRDNKVPLMVKGLRIDGLSIERVFNVHEAKHFLGMGGRNRHTGETKQNVSSSRSHAIFCIHFTADYGDKQISAKLNLVDLAGSESVKKTGTQGSSFQEGININKGLLCIGQVMTALSANLSYIPYRQSIITTILQDSLNKNNYISLIACVKTGTKDSNESIQTLEFAQRVKRMKNKPEINEVITKYKTEHASLFDKYPRISGTPMKRKTDSAVKLNPFKKPCGPSFLSDLSVPSATFDNSKSIASLSSTSNCGGSNFSPVIRKYMNELEHTIIDKLQTVIQNTLERPNKRITRSSISGGKENTPKYSWTEIQQKVSKLVQEEVVQLTTKTSRATSSPLDHSEINHAKRILKYDSPLFEQDISEHYSSKKSRRHLAESNESRESTLHVSSVNSVSMKDVKLDCEVDLIFKKPMAPLKINLEKSIISPIELLPPRRSTRISLRRSSILPEGINDISMRQTAKVTPCYECQHNRTLSKERRTKKIKNSNPQKNRIKEVLRILNQGDKKQLQNLSTVGPKTADRILLLRHLKGSFKSVKELSDMPGWSTSYYQKFMDQNFLEV